MALPENEEGLTEAEVILSGMKRRVEATSSLLDKALKTADAAATLDARLLKQINELSATVRYGWDQYWKLYNIQAPNKQEQVDEVVRKKEAEAVFNIGHVDKEDQLKAVEKMVTK